MGDSETHEKKTIVILLCFAEYHFPFILTSSVAIVSASANMLAKTSKVGRAAVAHSGTLGNLLLLPRSQALQKAALILYCPAIFNDVHDV